MFFFPEKEENKSYFNIAEDLFWEVSWQLLPLHNQTVSKKLKFNSMLMIPSNLSHPEGLSIGLSSLEASQLPW